MAEQILELTPIFDRHRILFLLVAEEGMKGLRHAPMRRRQVRSV